MSLAKEKQRREHAAKKRKEAEAKEAEAKANQEEYMQEVEKKFIASVEASNNAEAGEGDGGGYDSGATK